MVYATELLEKEHSGCRALLRNDKVLCSKSCALAISLLSSSFFLPASCLIFLPFSYFINALSVSLTLLLKVEDLSRIYTLYHKIPKGLDPVSAIFKQVSSFVLVFIFMTWRNLSGVHQLTTWC